MEQSSHFGASFYIFLSPHLSLPPWRSWSHLERRLSNFRLLYDASPLCRPWTNAVPALLSKRYQRPKVKVSRT